MCATLGALLALALPSRGVSAQGARVPTVQPEVRLDAIIGEQGAVQAGVGLQIPAGVYVRVGADAAAGRRTGAVAHGGANGRVDLLARFLLDPYQQARFGLSAGAGLSARFERGSRTTPLLLVALDLEEHRRDGGLTRALQVGLGGGARVGLVLRGGSIR